MRNLLPCGGAVAGAACLLAACAAADDGAPALARQLRADPPAVSAPLPPLEGGGASPAFARHFAPRGGARLHVWDGARVAGNLPPRPEFCAVGSDGSVYLGHVDSPVLAAWGLDGAVRAVHLDADGPVSPITLATRPGDASLYVVDGRRHHVRRHAPDGRLLEHVPLNAGQTTFSLVVLPSGELVAGGLRWERPDQATLVAVHDTAGRLRGAFFPMDAATLKNRLRVAPPVLLAPTGPSGFLAAEPSSPRVHRFDLAGRRLGSFGEPFAGYRPQVVVDAVGTDGEPMRAWLASWDPVVFLHHGAGATFVGFETRTGGRRTYRVEVFDADGRRVAGGLRHDAQPLCGRDGELVFAAADGAGAPRVWRYTYLGAGRGGAPGAHPSRSE